MGDAARFDWRKAAEVWATVVVSANAPPDRASAGGRQRHLIWLSLVQASRSSAPAGWSGDCSH